MRKPNRTVLVFILSALLALAMADLSPAQCIEGDCINGSGVKITRGHKYSGSFKNNHREGFGIYYFPNGDRYEGEFVHGVMEGKGTYFFANGDRYEGEFADNSRHGVGTYFHEDGEFEKGVWDHGRFVEPYAEVASQDLPEDNATDPDSVEVVPWGDGGAEDGGAEEAGGAKFNMF